MSPTATAMCPTADVMSHSSVVVSHPSDKAPPATVVALIAHARGVPSVAREAFAAKCHALQANDAVIIVHTCHRVEMYVALDAFGNGELPELPRGGERLEVVTDLELAGTPSNTAQEVGQNDA